MISVFEARRNIIKVQILTLTSRILIKESDRLKNDFSEVLAIEKNERLLIELNNALLEESKRLEDDLSEALFDYDHYYGMETLDREIYKLLKEVPATYSILESVSNKIHADSY